MRLRVLIFAVLTWVTTLSVLAQVEDANWAERLGKRSDETLQSFPVIDKVVLVPNAVTYLDELAKWSPKGRWPVLIEDEQYAPMFIRKFKPAQVIRRKPKGRTLSGPDELRDKINEVVVSTWGGKHGSKDIKTAFAARGHKPAGIVLTSAMDNAWTAAVALAAGRGQYLFWIEGDLGSTDRGMSENAGNTLLNSQISALESLKVPFSVLGDQIDAITVCREIPVKINVNPANNNKNDFRAVTDILGRGPDGKRFAIAGWIFGNRIRCAYVAMSSLFLKRDSALCFNTYSLTQGGWNLYAMSNTAVTLSEAGFEIELNQSDRASEDALLRKLPGGLDKDIIFFNTKGNQTFFDMYQGGQCYPGDIPILNQPAVVHLIHSWSANRPANPNTVAGQWIKRGAYAFYGSVQEPGLGAFLPSDEISSRLVKGVPFLVALRRWDQTGWRVAAYGDPLMTCTPTPAPGIFESKQERNKEHDRTGLDLNEHLKSVMRIADRTKKPDRFAEAIYLCNLLGQDTIGFRLWQASNSKNPDSLVSKAALPIIFRLRQSNEFMEAWLEAASTDSVDQDMLWHLMYPRISNEDILIQLHGTIRKHSIYGDLKRIVLHIATAFGKDSARMAIQRGIESTQSPWIKTQLNKLAKQIR